MYNWISLDLTCLYVLYNTLRKIVNSTEELDIVGFGCDNVVGVVWCSERVKVKVKVKKPGSDWEFRYELYAKVWLEVRVHGSWPTHIIQWLNSMRFCCCSAFVISCLATYIFVLFIQAIWASDSQKNNKFADSGCNSPNSLAPPLCLSAHWIWSWAENNTNKTKWTELQTFCQRSLGQQLVTDRDKSECEYEWVFGAADAQKCKSSVGARPKDLWIR